MHFQTTYFFDDISERDMDMLFMEEFACSSSFLELFAEEAGIITPACVKSIEISKMDPALGESDLTIIIESNCKRIGLLIEDKIDAIAMPEQSARYSLRGNKGIQNGDYDEFYIFIIAPGKYISQNSEAQKYPHKITYERIIKYFENQNDPRAEFKLQQVMKAVKKQKKGYQVEVDSAVTAFWKEYSAFQKSHYPGLYLIYNEEDKGTKATWPYFNTIYKGLYIQHKSGFGSVDLSFEHCADRIPEIEKMISKSAKDAPQNSYPVQRAGNSAVVRLTVPKLDFHRPFEEQRFLAEDCFAAIKQLSDLVKLLPSEQVSTFLKKR